MHIIYIHILNINLEFIYAVSIPTLLISQSIKYYIYLRLYLLCLEESLNFLFENSWATWDLRVNVRETAPFRQGLVRLSSVIAE